MAIEALIPNMTIDLQSLETLFRELRAFAHNPHVPGLWSISGTPVSRSRSIKGDAELVGAREVIPSAEWSPIFHKDLDFSYRRFVTSGNLELTRAPESAAFFSRTLIFRVGAL